MNTKKPLISILMAIYDPRMDWLEEQLDSLNAQTYPNLRLYVREDCSLTVPFEEVQKLVAQCITSFPFSVERNEENLGSNRTFERLTEEAEGEYFAYCDQDDVWLPEKLTVLQEEIEKNQAVLICSDMYIIDENGKQTYSSMTQARKHHIFRSGDHLAKKMLVSNFVTGCAMMVRSAYAKAAVPFCPEMVHDHYLGLWCAVQGRIISLPRQLIRYRIHAGNQTLMMAGVTDKESYFHVRIDALIRRLQWLKKHFPSNEELADEIQSALDWAYARKRNFEGHPAAKIAVLRGMRFSPLPSLFEIVLSGAPEGVFMFFVALKRRNVI